MKSLLTAVAIVAALCVASIAAPGQEDPFGTPPRPQDTLKAGDILSAPQVTKDEDASNGELRQEYLRVVEERSRDMSKAELESAINEAKAERHWNNATAKLRDAAKELAKIRESYPNTRHAKTAGYILGVLQSSRIDTGRPRGRTTAPPSQAPASRRQTQ